MNQAKYTVFCEASDGGLGWCGSGQWGAPDSLPELIQYICATGEFASLTGIAWAHGLIAIDDEATAKRVCAESIAAGRLIEKVDGKYVAREIHSPMIAAGSEEKLASVKVCEEPKREPLDWNKSTPFDPFKGYVVYSDAVSSGFVESPKHTHSHPLQKMAEGKEGFGSAALLKG